jgi:hypothetical protein
MMEALLGEIPTDWLFANEDVDDNVIADYFECGDGRFWKVRQFLLLLILFL